MKYTDTDIVIDKLLLKKIQEKKNQLDKLRPLPKDAVKKLIEDIRIRHTYNSDAIEGNTLTLQETKLVLEEGITIGGKPLKDHIEVKNDAEAFNLMIGFVNSDTAIKQEVIQKLHEVVTKGLLEDAGKYRITNVRITGSSTTPPDFSKIVKLMDEFIKNIKETKFHPLKKAIFIHYEFVRIHPFIDGNGRVARLLTNLYLMKQGYPPIILKKTERQFYYKSLNKANEGDLSLFSNFIARAVNESLMFYLSSFITDEKLTSLSDITKYFPYSQEYLSLRARQGKLDAVKIENIWYSSKRALREYMKNIE